MEWFNIVKESITFIEKNIKNDITAQDVSDHVFYSPLQFQRGFLIMTGYSVSEYIRNRKLYLAALEIEKTKKQIIDIALDFGYETPESFTKAFKRFHGISPLQARKGMKIKTFLPLNLSISIQGGEQMDYKIANLFGFKVIGFKKEFSFETSYQEIPKFWDEICEKYCKNIYAGKEPANAYEKAIVDNCIGEYAVCIDDGEAAKRGKFIYLVGGKYCGGEVPEGMMVYELPRGEWAIFDCIGPNPETLQSTNTKIFKEWLPGNKEYELNGNASVEWYDCINGEMSDKDYHSAIWVPIKRK